MQWITQLIVGVFLCFYCLVNHAAANSMLKTTHPNHHVVQPGDTLWDISAQFLNNPWDWRKVWKNNPEVENPDLIYPGDVISLSFVGDEPILSINNHAVKDGVIKLKPHARNVPLAQRVPTIPMEAIRAFLNKSRVVTEHELSETPYVLAEHGEHLITGVNDSIYVRGIDPEKGVEYNIYRKGQAYIHPTSKQVLGFEAEYIGSAKLEKVGDPAKLVITKSTQEVMKGDRLLPVEDENIEPYFLPKEPEGKTQGYVLSVFGGLNQVGQYQVVAISGGYKDGREVGEVLGVYKAGVKVRDKVKDKHHKLRTTYVRLPETKAGEMILFKTFEKISLGLVMDATMPIKLKDKVANP